jgi:hypothetical protein
LIGWNAHPNLLRAFKGVKYFNLKKSKGSQPLGVSEKSKAKYKTPFRWGGNEKILNLRPDKLSILNGLPHRFYKVI